MTHTPFSSWSGPLRPSLLLVGEAWGADEDITKLPFSGESGKELFRMLGEVLPDLNPSEHSRVSNLHKYELIWVKERDRWLSEASISFTNVFNFRPPDNKIPALCVKKDELPPSYSLPAISKGLYINPIYLPELQRLSNEISESSPNLVMALGNTACWALLQTTNIGSIRGTTTQAGDGFGKVKVLPTYHPAAVLRQWKWRPIVVADLMKGLREREFSQIRRPERTVYINPTLNFFNFTVEHILSSPPPYLAIDTETTAGMIDTIGFAASKEEAIVYMVGPHRVKIGKHYDLILPERDSRPVSSYFSFEEELQFWSITSRLLSSPIPKLFQNGVYDLQYLLTMGLKVNNCLEDTMLLHHSLHPEIQKSLGFLGSIYTDEASWKLMRKHKGDSEKRDE